MLVGVRVVLLVCVPDILGEAVSEGDTDDDAVSEGDTDDDAVSDGDIELDPVSDADTEGELVSEADTEGELVSDADMDGEADRVAVILGNTISYTKLYVHAGNSLVNIAPSVDPNLYKMYPLRGSTHPVGSPPLYSHTQSDPTSSQLDTVPISISGLPPLYKRCEP